MFLRIYEIYDTKQKHLDIYYLHENIEKFISELGPHKSAKKNKFLVEIFLAFFKYFSKPMKILDMILHVL